MDYGTASNLGALRSPQPHRHSHTHRHLHHKGRHRQPDSHKQSRQPKKRCVSMAACAKTWQLAKWSTTVQNSAIPTNAIAQTRAVRTSTRLTRHDLLLCLFCPLLVSVLVYLASSHPFDPQAASLSLVSHSHMHQFNNNKQHSRFGPSLIIARKGSGAKTRRASSCMTVRVSLARCVVAISNTRLDSRKHRAVLPRRLQPQPQHSNPRKHKQQCRCRCRQNQLSHKPQRQYNHRRK